MCSVERTLHDLIKLASDDNFSLVSEKKEVAAFQISLQYITPVAIAAPPANAPIITIAEPPETETISF